MNTKFQNTKTFRFLFLTRIVLAYLFCDFSPLAGQSLDDDFGARSQSMGHANATLADEWSLFNNVGGISDVEKGSVFFGYHRFFDIDGFDKVALGIVQPFEFGSVGLSAFRFGDALYSEQMLSTAFGNKIGFVRLGLRASYYQLRIDDFGTSSAFMFDLGGIVELIPNVSFGAYISNFTVSTLNNMDQSKLPVSMKAGISYQPTQDIMLNLDIHKDVDFDPEIRAGLEYRIIEKVFVRTGINSNPFKAYFGGGLKFGRFKVDYAVTSHQYLGIAHQASVVFAYQD
jgi:hypothetical protein